MTDIVQRLDAANGAAQKPAQHCFSEILPGGDSRPNLPAQTATTAAQVTHGEAPNEPQQEERI
jgi:hypothetical protein